METFNLGHRVDLLSMDPHFYDISISIYRTDGDDGTHYLLHSYSKRQGVHDRLEILGSAMQTMGGMVTAGKDPLSLRFVCGHPHETALKRLFTEACKVDLNTVPEMRKLVVLDKKNDLSIRAELLGNGRYRCIGDRDGDREKRRVAITAAGLGKLAELSVEDDEVDFPCATDHHELIGLLLTRALNVRGALREQEAAAARGVLSAPSQQR